MAQYRMEDVEVLRRKSGIGYEEAINLLEYHNGSLARALVDLERNGKIKDEEEQAQEQEKGTCRDARGFFNRLYHIRVHVRKNKTTVLNLSLLASILIAIFCPYLVVFGVIFCLILGYRIRIDRTGEGFSDESLDGIVRNAAQNVRNTVSSFAREFTSDERRSAGETAPEGSYYQTRQATAAGTQPAPREPAAKPVSVPINGEGNVTTRTDDDGFHEADVE